MRFFGCSYDCGFYCWLFGLLGWLVVELIDLRLVIVVFWLVVVLFWFADCAVGLSVWIFIAGLLPPDGWWCLLADAFGWVYLFCFGLFGCGFCW